MSTRKVLSDREELRCMLAEVVRSEVKDEMSKVLKAVEAEMQDVKKTLTDIASKCSDIYQVLDNGLCSQSYDPDLSDEVQRLTTCVQEFQARLKTSLEAWQRGNMYRKMLPHLMPKVQDVVKTEEEYEEMKWKELKKAVCLRSGPTSQTIASREAPAAMVEIRNYTGVSLTAIPCSSHTVGYAERSAHGRRPDNLQGKPQDVAALSSSTFKYLPPMEVTYQISGLKLSLRFEILENENKLKVELGIFDTYESHITQNMRSLHEIIQRNNFRQGATGFDVCLASLDDRFANCGKLYVKHAGFLARLTGSSLSSGLPHWELEVFRPEEDEQQFKEDKTLYDAIVGADSALQLQPQINNSPYNNPYNTVTSYVLEIVNGLTVPLEEPFYLPNYILKRAKPIPSFSRAKLPFKDKKNLEFPKGGGLLAFRIHGTDLKIAIFAMQRCYGTCFVVGFVPANQDACLREEFVEDGSALERNLPSTVVLERQKNDYKMLIAENRNIRAKTWLNRKSAEEEVRVTVFITTAFKW